MFFKQITRLLHTSRVAWMASEKSALATLRKKTGYTFANCKKALELHENDLAKVGLCYMNFLTISRIFFSGRNVVEGASASYGMV